jgi:hypothetical protein
MNLKKKCGGGFEKKSISGRKIKSAQIKEDERVRTDGGGEGSQVAASLGPCPCVAG